RYRRSEGMSPSLNQDPSALTQRSNSTLVSGVLLTVTFRTTSFDACIAPG
ncbi:hypothetical protein IG631_23889, partial [Alternaria alternata]